MNRTREKKTPQQYFCTDYRHFDYSMTVSKFDVYSKDADSS